MWGANDRGQLGLGQGLDAVSTPIELKTLRGHQILGVACGCFHCIAFSSTFSSNGFVWSWGDNSSAQLGLGNEYDAEIIHEPCLIESLSGAGVQAVAAGRDHSMAMLA